MIATVLIGIALAAVIIGALKFFASCAHELGQQYDDTVENE